MPEFLKKHRNVIIGVFIIAAVLAAAFLSGGSLKNGEESQADAEAQMSMETVSQETETWQEIFSETEKETQPARLEAAEEANKASEASSVEAVKGKETMFADPAKELQSAQSGEEKKQTFSCTISISCELLLSNPEQLEEAKRELLPSDGWILKPVNASFTEGESVFDVLKRVCKENKIPLEFSWTPVYHAAYIEGIYNLYEFDCGSLSGWVYVANGVVPSYGCSSYLLKEGDVIVWQYSLKRGMDIGG